MSVGEMSLAETLDGRYSCRGFLDKVVPRETVERIVTTAQKVPSWCNSQPWHLSITTPETTKRLAGALMGGLDRNSHAPDIAFPERYEGVYKTRRAVCGWQLYDAVGVQKGDREGSAAQMRRNFDFFGAPHTAIVTTPRTLGTYGVLDCGAFVTAFTLAAWAEGVASIPQAAIAGYAPMVRDVLGLSEERNVLCAISFGYEDPAHPANRFRTERAPLSEVVEWQ